MSVTASTSLSVLRFIEEITLGVTPASALTEVRQTANSLVRSQSYKTSGEIRSDRNIRDNILVDMEPSGSFNFELSYSDFDKFMEGALFSAWSTAVNVTAATDIAAVASGNQFTSTSTDFTTKNIVVGQWIKISGFATSANNGIAKVVSVAANALVVSGLTLVNESATPAITMTGQRLRNGVTQKSYTLENEFTDIVQFLSFTGMMVNNFTLDVKVGDVVTGSVGFMGLSSARGTSTVGTGAAIAGSNNDIMNGVSDVSNILENGTLLSTGGVYVLSTSIDVNNGLKGQKAVGTLGNVGLLTGRANVTGKLEVYFKNGSLYDKLINDTSTSLSFRITDGTNTYVVTLPKLKFNGGDPTVSGVDANVILPLGFQAIYDTTTACTIQIDRL